MVLRESEDTFYIKRGETTPALEVQLTDEDDNPIDLSSVDGVDFKMYEPRNYGLVIDASATIVNESDGIVTYVWKEGETDDAGRYRSGFVVNYDSASSEEFPNFGYRDVLVWGTNDAPTGTDVDKSWPADSGDE